MSSAKKNETLAKVKLALALKCERLAKTVHSEPRRKTYLYHAARFRRQVADLSR
jgi:hypothetical protein